MSDALASDSGIIRDLRRKYEVVSRLFDERRRRIWAGIEAQSLGRGGIAVVAAATGLARNTIRVGMAEIASSSGPLETDRIRRAGGGRKLAEESDPELLTALENLVDPLSRGDPESPLRWTVKSLRQLAGELATQGRSVSVETVRTLLKSLGYSLQANAKVKEGGTHPDRNAQFERINGTVKKFNRQGQPAISVDAKKKELVGDFKNAGRQWRPQGQPEQVRVHDFVDPALGKAIPYGVYDMTRNEGWVSVGIDHDTADFAVATIRMWWRQMGCVAYPNAKRLLITADCGGSNGYRSRAWKVGLQDLADELGLSIVVCHLPPGTSKWNKIEHRLFSFISQNWKGQPLISHEVIVNLIGSTTTKTGLKVKAQLDINEYPTGIQVSDQEIRELRIRLHQFHGEWNYTIRPRYSTRK